MVLADGMGPSGAASCATVLGMLVVCSLSAACCAIVAGRVALEFSRRLILAIVAAVACIAPAGARRATRYAFTIVTAREIALLAHGRGLRAPPSFVH
jgi:hypothetical protein